MKAAIMKHSFTILLILILLGASLSPATVNANTADLSWKYDLSGKLQPPNLSLLPNLSGTSPQESTLIDPHQRAELSEQVHNVVAGNNEFALAIYRHLADQKPVGENMLISPFSISTALAMTYAGARGQTSEQMSDALRFGQSGDNLHVAFGELLADLDMKREGYELNVANRIFGQQGISFKKPFVSKLARDYKAPLEFLNFRADSEAARNHINSWVEDQTNDRIQNLLPQGSVDSNTRLVLTNAVYFDGNWKHKFNEQATREEEFTTANDQAVPVSMMFQKQAFNYASLDDFQILEMPYAGDDLSMVVMLPNETGGLADLEDSLTTDMLLKSLEAMDQREVLVKFPKFTFDSSFGLRDTLADMGMLDAFTSAADFSGMADDDLQISDVLHKTFIDVNEAGTEAAAATAVAIVVTDALLKPDPPLFDADHPFLFALRDTHSGSLLFMGRVTQPGELGSSSSSVPEPSTAAIGCFAILILCLNSSRVNI